jgi:DNA-directed RNA polymerase specialized sigma24 family protein
VGSRLAVADLQKAADSLVIALACAGDDSAFTEVLRRRQARVRKFMYHLCRHTALGDDLAQQVFLTAWRSLATVSDVELADLAVQHDTTAARMDLDAALSTLPADMRLCVVLAYNEGMSHPEIVALTGAPLGTVKSHIARGAARLREILADYGERS